MKKLLAVALIAGMALTVRGAETEDAAGVWLDNMASNMGRGFVNVLTAGVELPRNLWYDNVRMPIIGILPGAMDGAFLTVVRALGGVTDIVTLGLTGPGIYTESFPEYVWESPWLPEDEQIMLKNKPIQ